MTTVVTRGAASAQALGYASSSAAVNYIEDVFSTYLYTGNGSTQTITNGIDLSTKGGMVWLKGRSGATDHALYDTARGATKDLVSNSAAAETTQATGLTAFSGTGFSLGALAKLNTSADTYASWTFRKQPKFFDVVTYTGDGIAGRTVAHNLGSAPGCIIVKCTSLGATTWQVYHVGLGAMPKRIALNSTNAADSLDHFYATPTSSVFYVNNYQTVNQNAATYVAYLFAHDAGGFGLTGTDNVISCGSYTGNGSSTGPVVTLGYEPQWLLIKNATTGSTAWMMQDVMRGLFVGGNYANLTANTSESEVLDSPRLNISATGFQIITTNNTYNASGNTYIYIAIRRGPMKVPTSGTSVYNAISRTGTGANVTVTGIGFTPDLLVDTNTDATASEPFRFWFDRLRGLRFIASNNTLAEAGSTDSVTGFDVMNAINLGTSERTNFSALPYINWFFRRAPGFFDEVCYTGTGANMTVTHNLAAVPEMMILKMRSSAGYNWFVYHSALGNSSGINLNSTGGSAGYGTALWNSTTPTSTVFSLGTNSNINNSGDTFVNYLFATCAGVSKVGSYTGTGTTQVINCGFTAGARFIMIKRTDSTGDWYVWNSARGIVAGNDPYLLLNSADAEVTNTDFVDTAASGFEISSTAPAAINANGGSFIFLSIA